MLDRMISEPTSRPTAESGDLTPAQTAEMVVRWSNNKASLPIVRIIVLGLMAGAFIALGGAFFTLVMTDSGQGLAATRVLGGLCFSMGLLLVAMTGAELSTGNCLALAAVAAGRMSPLALARVLGVSFAANVGGALLVFLLMWASGLLTGPIGIATSAITWDKLALPLHEVFARALLCNVLVCLAVWMILATRSPAGKLIGIVFPITAFVALGFEHSIANFYLIPAGLAAGVPSTVLAVVSNALVVTLGNLVGGLLVAVAIWAGFLWSPPVMAKTQTAVRNSSPQPSNL